MNRYISASNIGIAGHGDKYSFEPDGKMKLNLKDSEEISEMMLANHLSVTRVLQATHVLNTEFPLNDLFTTTHVISPSKSPVSTLNNKPPLESSPPLQVKLGGDIISPKNSNKFTTTTHIATKNNDHNNNNNRSNNPLKYSTLGVKSHANSKAKSHNSGIISESLQRELKMKTGISIPNIEEIDSWIVPPYGITMVLSCLNILFCDNPKGKTPKPFSMCLCIF